MHVFGVLKIFTQGALFKTVNVDSLLVERVAISDNGVVLVENGIEKFMPEQVILFFGKFQFYINQWAAMQSVSSVEKMPPGEPIGWSGAIEWRNDEVHAISDKRNENSWPASVF